MAFKILDIRPRRTVTLRDRNKQGEPYNRLSLLPGESFRAVEQGGERRQRPADSLVEDTGRRVGETEAAGEHKAECGEGTAVWTECPGILQKDHRYSAEDTCVRRPLETEKNRPEGFREHGLVHAQAVHSA